MASVWDDHKTWNGLTDYKYSSIPLIRAVLKHTGIILQNMDNFNTLSLKGRRTYAHIKWSVNISNRLISDKFRHIYSCSKKAFAWRMFYIFNGLSFDPFAVVVWRLHICLIPQNKYLNRIVISFLNSEIISSKNRLRQKRCLKHWIKYSISCKYPKTFVSLHFLLSMDLEKTTLTTKSTKHLNTFSLLMEHSKHNSWTDMWCVDCLCILLQTCWTCVVFFTAGRTNGPATVHPECPAEPEA